MYSDKDLAKYAEAINLDASPENIGLTKNKIFMVLRDAENEFEKIICNLSQTIGESFKKLEAEVERRESALNAFKQAKNALQNTVNP